MFTEGCLSFVLFFFPNIQKDKNEKLYSKVMFVLQGCTFLRKTECSYLQDFIWNLKLEKFASKS